MNFNIFSPKGEIDRSTFVIYYILLTVLYFIIGWLIFPWFLKYKWELLFVEVLLFVVNLFVFFNYKKRIIQFVKNLFACVTLSLILTFDHLALPILLQKDGEAYFIIFLILVIFVFIVQPAVIALIPAKNIENS